MSITRVGVSAGGLRDICSNLRTDSSQLQSFVEELNSLEKELQNYWEGDDLVTFQSEFAKFKANLEEMPVVVESIAKWGESTADAYEEATLKSKNMFSEIFNS